MPRPERLIDVSNGVVGEFAEGLRALRRSAGTVAYRTMAAAAGYSVTTLSDAAGGRQFPQLDVVLAYVQACGGDRDEWERRWREVGAHMADAGADETGQSPYPGLARFERADADRFFGRDRLIAEFGRRLASDRLLTVFGASGSGKSSLLRAGLVPTFEAQGMAPAKILIITPGAHPMREHAAAAKACPGLIVVDQFEEVFTMCRDAAVREAFANLLVDAATRAGCDTRVVLGVRADFFAQCAQLPRLAPLLPESTAVVGPMTDSELRAAVTGPAGLAGLTVERALLTQLAADVRGQAGALPMLSHALLETWRERRSTTLTVAGYQATGGIAGAIARTAERAYAALSPDQQSITRQVMTRLTALGDGTDDTRRRIRRDELDLPGAPDVVHQLVDARLLVIHDDTVEIAHEALIGSWPRLHEWLAVDRDFIRTHRRLSEATQSWSGLGEDPGALLRGTLLATIRDRTSELDGTGTLLPVERRFLEASITAEHAEQDAAQRRTTRLRRLSTSLVAMLVLAAAAAGVAGWKSLAADQASRDSTSREFAAQAIAVLPTDTSQAMRLSLAGYAQSPTVEARSSLLSIAGWHTYTSKLQASAPVKDTAFTPDGTLIVMADQNGGITVWDRRTNTVRAVLTRGHASAVRSIAISRDGLLAAGGLDGAVTLWNLATNVIVAQLAAPSGQAHRVAGVAFSPDGTLLAAAFQGAPIRMWSLPARTELSKVPDAGATTTEVTFSGDGRTLDFIDGNDAVIWDLTARREIARRTFPDTPDTFAVTRDARYVAVGSRTAPDITVWDRSTATTRLLRGQTQYVSTLTFAPDGRTLISGGYDLDAIVWDVTAPGRSAEIGTLSGHASEIFAVAVSPDGRTVAAASRDRTVLTWDRSDIPLTGHTDQVATIAVSPDDRLIASAGKDDTIVLWDPVARAPRAVLTGHTDRVAGVAFSPDGTLLASAGDDRTVRVWDTRTYAQIAVFGGSDQMYSVAFSPDGTTLAAGGADGTLYRWHTGTWQPTASRHFTNPADGPARIATLAYDPRGRWLAVAQSDGRITLVGMAGDARLDAGSALNTIAVSADGALVAIGTPDGSVLIRDIAHSTTTSLPHAQTNTVNALAFSPDGRLLATGSTDRTVDLWDLRTRTLWASLSGPRYDIQSVSWTPDSTVIYAGAGDHTVTPWTVNPAQAVATLCADLHRNFPTEPSPGCSATP